MDGQKILRQLHQLAYLYNVQTAYYDLNHRRQQFSAESLLGVLKALDAPVNSMSDISSAIRERKLSLRRRMMEPVVVAWNGVRPEIKLCFPAGLAYTPVTCRLETETGETSTWKVHADDLPVIEQTDIEGMRYITRGMTLPKNLPWGYHRLTLEVKGNTGETLIISAPRRTYAPSGDTESRLWGAFMPLYALRSRDGWGSGDYATLGTLVDGVAGKGGRVVATLPLLPVFLDEPFEPSPYTPISRLLWNEFYVDVTGVPEFKICAAAQRLVHSASFREEIIRQQKNPMVDYRKIMSLKRRVMAELSKSLFSSPGARLEEFNRFIRENPVVEKYAAFRALMEKRHTAWAKWPQRLRDGTINENDYDDEIKKYHMYAQWLAQQQVHALSVNARAKGVRMYFDLPLGVHADGFDAWQQRDIFAMNATTGAPPDAVFTNGQNWGFPPLHPEKIRENGYRYVIDYLRHHLRYADILRIDHVMGLHRLFWIPKGLDSSQGVYVRYHAEELYAILALESHRHRNIIVGEDLGIVPAYVRKTMAGHGLCRMYVLYYELADNPSKALRSIAPNSVASLNTHDMSPFAAFWQGADIEERINFGLSDENSARKERKSRHAVKSALTAYLREKKFLRKIDTGTRAVMNACLAYLSSSRARIVLVNLEDLWLETKPQNMPGVGDKFPSWQRKARYMLEGLFRMKEVSDTLKKLDRHGKRKTGKEG
jgi:4-alpha-glucanotransferase